MPVEHCDDGSVIFLAARAPGQVAAQVTSGAVAYRGAKAGNANFDPASGRFASKQLKDVAVVNENPVPVTRSGIPQGITQQEWERRLDMVREAARELAAIDANGAQKFLKNRVTDLSRVDIAQFMTDVRAHQMDDLLDAFDSQMRKSKGGIKVTATASWVKSVFRSLTDPELTSLVTRLQARGFSAKQIGGSVASRVKDEAVRDRLTEQLKVKLEDEDQAPLDFEDWEPEPVKIDGTPDRGPEIYALADAIKELAGREQPAPVIHVAPAEVKLELPPPRQKRIVRDPVTNEIIGVDPVYVPEPDAG